MATQARTSDSSNNWRAHSRQAANLSANLMAVVKANFTEEQGNFISSALDFAVHAHRDQRRKSGSPFIEHPIATAQYLAQLRMDPDTVAAGLLHDTMEDCDVEYKELVDRFNPSVAALVDSVTKLNADGSMLPWNSDGSAPITGGLDGGSEREATLATARAASMRKMFVAMAKDVRVVVIKLADRLHNMLTLKALPHHRQIAIARETLDIYAPLAHRLGMWDLKWRLEDESFKYLQPREFRALSRLLQRKRAEREEYVERVTAETKQALGDAGIEAEVTGRAKHIYSIHQKAARYAAQGKKLTDIHDFFALRVFVDSVGDCYAALGVIHGIWPPMGGQFDDYIASPKENMYQSLHTTVRAVDGLPVEVQIRTPEMHNISENGIAAHTLYKEGGVSRDRFDEGMTLLRQLLESDRDQGEDFEWLEQIKTDILQDQVFVYTPAGDVVELPAGGTSLDFAYKIHTDLGHQTGGAIVNGKLTGLNKPLHNGDTVTIQKRKGVGKPRLDWLNPDLGYLKTASARTKVSQWFRRQERDAQQAQGREFLSRQLRRLHGKLSHEDVADAMGYGSPNELYELIGSGELHAGEVVAKLMSTTPDPPEQIPEKPLKKVDGTSGTIVMGMSGLLTREALCCNPVYGDDIVGYLTRGRGVTIHRALCSNLRGKDQPERLVEVDWGHSSSRIPARFKIEAWDRVGLIRDLTSLVGEETVNIHSLTSTEDEETNTCTVTLTVYTTGSKQLSRLFSQLENVRGVFGIVRQGL